MAPACGINGQWKTKNGKRQGRRPSPFPFAMTHFPSRDAR
jgi:hypothetical protein